MKLVDATTHLIEPADLWLSYLEPELRARSLRVEHTGSRAYLTCEGHRLGPAIDEVARYEPTRVEERVRELDRAGIGAAVVLPTLSLFWEAHVRDPVLALGFSRAYNRWAVDRCREARGRLVPLAQISMLDAAGAAEELERAVRDGCRGALVAPFTHGTSHGHPDHDAVYAKLEQLGVPLVIHPAIAEPAALVWRRYQGLDEARWYEHVVDCHGAQTAFTMLFANAVFDRFPKLAVAVLGIGAGWVGYWMDRMDALYAIPAYRWRLAQTPSHYVRTRCWFGADIDERTLAGLARFAGADRFVWGSHSPHRRFPAHDGGDVQATLAQLPADIAPRIAGDNATTLFGIS